MFDARSGQLIATSQDAGIAYMHQPWVGHLTPDDLVQITEKDFRSKNLALLQQTLTKTLTKMHFQLSDQK